MVNKLLTLLTKHGGTIVSTNDCSEREIHFARVNGYLYTDEDNLGYIWKENVITVNAHRYLIAYNWWDHDNGHTRTYSCVLNMDVTKMSHSEILLAVIKEINSNHHKGLVITAINKF